MNVKLAIKSNTLVPIMSGATMKKGSSIPPQEDGDKRVWMRHYTSAWQYGNRTATPMAIRAAPPVGVEKKATIIRFNTAFQVIQAKEKNRVIFHYNNLMPERKQEMTTKPAVVSISTRVATLDVTVDE